VLHQLERLLVAENLPADVFVERRLAVADLFYETLQLLSADVGADHADYLPRLANLWEAIGVSFGPMPRGHSHATLPTLDHAVRCLVSDIRADHPFNGSAGQCQECGARVSRGV
jgi:hypothetical protein